MHHRPYMKRAEDEARAVALAASGSTQREIAATLGIGLATVNEHLQHARRLWTEQAMSDITELQGRELETLDRVESEAWNAWTKSKGGESGGDPRLLEIVVKTSTRRAKLLGLDQAKPTTVIALEQPPASDDGLNDLERRMLKYKHILGLDSDVIEVEPITSPPTPS